MKKNKKTYNDSKNKKIVREFILTEYILIKFSLEKIIGLPGPDIKDYLKYLKSKGFKEFELYENNSDQWYKQIFKLHSSRIFKSKISYLGKDILHASYINKNVFYDLDFCASVRYLQNHIKKFKSNFIMTFSYRGVGLQYTIDTFFKCREEKILDTQELNSPLKHTIFTTNNGKYIFVKYYDTSAMCCFAKI